MIATITLVTVRSLLARRRAILMLLVAAVPVLLGLLARLNGGPENVPEATASVLDTVIVATLLPIVALVFGTASLGAELDDGSAIHLLTKPVARWRIVAAKVLAPAPVVAGLAGAATLVTGLLIGDVTVTVAYTLAVVVGAVVYVLVFVALSVFTTRALIIGLVYVVVWEGMLAGLFEGTRVLSVRQYVTAIASALDSSGVIGSDAIEPTTALVGVVLVSIVAFVLAVRRLERYQLTAGD